MERQSKCAGIDREENERKYPWELGTNQVMVSHPSIGKWVKCRNVHLTCNLCIKAHNIYIYIIYIYI